MTLTTRYTHLAAQHAYERDVAARGLPALFAAVPAAACGVRAGAAAAGGDD